jgi:hypothetical protein
LTVAQSPCCIQRSLERANNFPPPPSLAEYLGLGYRICQRQDIFPIIAIIEVLRSPQKIAPLL